MTIYILGYEVWEVFSLFYTFADLTHPVYKINFQQLDKQYRVHIAAIKSTKKCNLERTFHQNVINK